MDRLPQDVDGVESVEVLCRFRRDFYACLDARADVLFELADAVLCGRPGRLAGGVVPGR